MTGDGWKWLEWLQFAGINKDWYQRLERVGNCWNGWTWMEMARKGWKLLEWLKSAVNYWNC